MLKFTYLIRKIPSMSRESFIDYHRNKHAPLFMSIPEAKQYVRKYVVSHPTSIDGFPAPAYDAVTDIYFSSMDDFNRFFASENYKTIVHPDESNFFDLDDVIALVCQERVVTE